jgi:single-stranded-DNA-specific exonuclease
MRAAGITPANLDTHDIGFSLGPRLNAIGRLDHTLSSLRLLCTTSATRAAKLAQTLSDVNTTRQELTQDLLALAQSQLGDQPLDHVIIVASSEFHEGIIGLIASKLVDQHHRPALVIALGEQVAKGSARSIAGFDITAFLRQCQSDFISLGGHQLAAGFAVARAQLPSLRSKLQHLSARQLPASALTPRYDVDCPVSLPVLYDPQLPEFLATLEPHGAGNPPLILQVSGYVHDWRLLGAQQQHLKINLIDAHGTHLDLLFWRYLDHHFTPPPRGTPLTAIGELKMNHYRGSISPNIFGIDYRLD